MTTPNQRKGPQLRLWLQLLHTSLQNGNEDVDTEVRQYDLLVGFFFSYHVTSPIYRTRSFIRWMGQNYRAVTFIFPANSGIPAEFNIRHGNTYPTYLNSYPVTHGLTWYLCKPRENFIFLSPQSDWRNLLFTSIVLSQTIQKKSFPDLKHCYLSIH